MTGKIFRSALGASLTVLLAALLVFSGCLYGYFGSVWEQQLREELRLAASAVETEGDDYLSSLPAGTACRFTWVAPDGTVLRDTQADAASMENHAQREEIRQALTTGSGSSVRYSDTLTEKTVYEAVRLSDGSVLRIAGSQKTVGMLVLGLLHAVIAVALLAAGLSALLASRAAKRVVAPLNQLDLEHPLKNDAYDELSPLLSRIHAQQQTLHRQARDLERRQDEFEQITDSMREGLLLLGQDHRILSINPAAQTLFGTDRSCIGRDFLTVDRRSDISAAVDAALTQGHAQLRQQRQGREYQIDLSRIDSGGEVFGAVLLAFDVTEQAEAERMRREFTANVSHELKTPLTSISGYAEIMMNGLVRAEDIPGFSKRIYKEARRLITLVEDIIKLSKLDEESVELEKEDVELYELTREIVSRLSPQCSEKKISVALSGEPVFCHGIRQILDEMIYNITENAIKYNRDGGSVSVWVGNTLDGPKISVSDTGIGIPEEHQERIFERFYRVDKSHSKERGGTGLGLSIVKHGAILHGAKVTVNSEPGKGTKIEIRFPKEEKMKKAEVL